MKRILMAIMAVVVAISFSAPAFADDTTKPAPKEEKKKKGDTHMIYGDTDKKKDEKKDEKKGEKKGETKK